MPISASFIRKLIKRNHIVKIKEFVPEATYNYLLSDEIPDDFITQTNPVVLQLVKQNFIQINPNYDVQFIIKIVGDIKLIGFDFLDGIGQDRSTNILRQKAHGSCFQ